MSTPIMQYLNKTKKKLVCFSSTKKRLISNLQSELLEYADEVGTGLSYDALCQKFGLPEQVGAVLQDSIDEKEIKKVTFRRKFFIAIVFTILITLCLALFYLYEESMKIDEGDVEYRTVLVVDESMAASVANEKD